MGGFLRGICACSRTPIFSSITPKEKQSTNRKDNLRSLCVSCWSCLRSLIELTVMWSVLNIVALASVSPFVLISGSATPAVLGPRQFSVDALRPLLSRGANISLVSSTSPRWSEYNAPTPGAIVNVATEQDVVATVSTCFSPYHVPVSICIGQILQCEWRFLSCPEWCLGLDLELRSWSQRSDHQFVWT